MISMEYLPAPLLCPSQVVATRRIASKAEVTDRRGNGGHGRRSFPHGGRRKPNCDVTKRAICPPDIATHPVVTTDEVELVGKGRHIEAAQIDRLIRLGVHKAY